MARPQKEGLTYFPMDTDIDQDDKLIVPIAKHGMLGFGVIVKLMMEIYKNGYYYPWTQKEIHVFPFKVHVDSEKVCEIIADCVESGFFSEDQMVRNNILTSYGFQKRFLLAATRRKDSEIDPRYVVKKGENELMSTETELMHAITPLMSAISTQSKLNESKVNKTIKTSSLNKESTYSEDDIYYQMSVYFYNKIMEHAIVNKKDHLVKNSDLKKWREEFRKIVEIDKRDIKELREIIDWCQADSFWQINILSPSKLRKQYVQLGMKKDAKKGYMKQSESNKDALQRRMKEVTEDAQRRGIANSLDNRT
jgi:hypothetical protein